MHSSEETQTAKRVSGGTPLRGSARQAVSLTAATERASGVGTFRVGASTPCVASNSVTKSRNTTGSPSVTKWRCRAVHAQQPARGLRRCCRCVLCRSDGGRRRPTRSARHGPSRPSPEAARYHPAPRRTWGGAPRSRIRRGSRRGQSSALAFVELSIAEESGRSGAVRSPDAAAGRRGRPRFRRERGGDAGARAALERVRGPLHVLVVDHLRGPHRRRSRRREGRLSQPSAPAATTSRSESSPRTAQRPAPPPSALGVGRASALTPHPSLRGAWSAPRRRIPRRR